MPQVNLTDVTAQELRRLLDSSRRRGDAALSYKILQEMAARRDAPAKRRQAGPRLVAVELGEPLEDDDLPPMPNWRPPPREVEALASPEPEAASASAPAPRPSRRKRPPAPAMASVAAVPVAAVVVEPPPPTLETSRPLRLQDADPPPQDEAVEPQEPELRLRAAAPEKVRPPRQPRFGGVATFAVGLALGIALGWWGGRIARDVLSPSAAPAPIQTAALTPQPTPAPAPLAPVLVEPTPEAAVPPAAAATPPPQDVTPPSSDQEPAREPESPAGEPSRPATRSAEAVRTAETAPSRSPPAAASGCAAEPTPADRAICGDPRLRRLQDELRQAYAEALDAHQDRDLLRQRQLAWRDARSTVTDPSRLAGLYEARIRKLNAATAEARQQR
ncbi:hypothetical protein [Phenylobacterium sp.]|uniref:hypothetical protein n=1 Tax=Phenylobacterium sp. TaxID=1871053 RepID=UPI003567BED1